MKNVFYQVDSATLVLSDSIEYLNGMPENSVDMIFADPPYHLSNGGFTVHSGKRVSVHKGKWDESQGVENDFGFHSLWIAACRRVLKPEGTIWISGTYHSIYACGYALLLEGFKILNDISWYKPNAAPNLSGRYFTASHETLIWAKKDPKAKHLFNYQLMKNGEWDDRLKNPGKQMRSVWAITSPKSSEKVFGKHPTQKPLALLERVLLASTNEGDLVVDPFTGSSTTGVAALMHGRKFIGIDIDKEYLQLSKQRLEEVIG
jgi:site-specific DNA-methyltransferase (adenine-specific)